VIFNDFCKRIPRGLWPRNKRVSNFSIRFRSTDICQSAELAFINITAATALTPMGSTSVIRSANCANSSSSCLVIVNVGCTCCGRRYSHKDLSISSDSLFCMRSLIRRRNCNERRSAHLITLRSFFSALSTKLLINLSLSAASIHRGHIVNFNQGIVVKAL